LQSSVTPIDIAKSKKTTKKQKIILEIKNIEEHRFMPKLFVKPTRLVRYKKSETRRRNNRTRKHK
jgi:hypothetical protein